MKTYGRRSVRSFSNYATFSDDEDASSSRNHGISSLPPISENDLKDEGLKPQDSVKADLPTQVVENRSSSEIEIPNRQFEASAWLFLFASMEKVTSNHSFHADLDENTSPDDTSDDERQVKLTPDRPTRVDREKIRLSEKVDVKEYLNEQVEITLELEGSSNAREDPELKQEAKMTTSNLYSAKNPTIFTSKLRRIYGEQRSYLETPPQTAQMIMELDDNTGSSGLDATDLQQLGKKRRRDEEIEYLILGLQSNLLTSGCNSAIIESCIGIWDLGDRSKGHNELVAVIEELWPSEDTLKPYQNSIELTFLVVALYGLVTAGHEISPKCIKRLSIHKMPESGEKMLHDAKHGLLEIQACQAIDFYDSVVEKLKPEALLCSVLACCSDHKLALNLLCERFDNPAVPPLISAILKTSTDLVTQIDTGKLSELLLHYLASRTLDTCILEIAVVLQAQAPDSFAQHLNQFTNAVVGDINQTILKGKSHNKWDFPRLLVELAFLLDSSEHVPESTRAVLDRLKDYMPTPDSVLHIHVNVYYALNMGLLGCRDMCIQKILQRYGDHIEGTAITQRITEMNATWS